MNMDYFRHFTLDEFDCKGQGCCGGDNRMDLEFVELLDDLREKCGFALRVTSGYRCPVHNERVSSTGPAGPHTTGKSCDFGVSHERAVIVLEHALKMPFKGIGVNQKGSARFIHLDCTDRPVRHIWTY